ncbi:hypothetical protein [Mucilaginibacter rubeus]|uniref:Lipoprotein n=1 Tax=Mucilaginibacter rubeus TaxID=2027860 RepID=A0A5C1HTA5_9SPHI|nr:hypothetical protein [Mucilaginibacter rubeus]QEM09277.1 hypothetical protein DEO27_004365 [Mucilaginibacter rubeus]
MKLSRLLLLASLIVVGCKPLVKITDGRPEEQLAFIKKFHVADSLYSQEENEIKKKEILDEQRAQLSKFITDTLHANVNKWQAIVSKIEVHNAPVDHIEITLLLTKDGDLDPGQKYPYLSNIVLFAQIKLEDPLKNKLKELLKDDKVLITGELEKTLTGDVEIQNNEHHDEATFSNPQFELKIESISKIDPKDYYKKKP